MNVSDPKSASFPVPQKLYDRNFLIAFASQSFFVTANACMAHYGRWIEFLGGDELHVGLVMGAGPIASLLLRPWTGPWIDRVGARATQAIGYVCFMITVASNLMLHDLGLPIYVMRAATAVSAALIFSSGIAYVTQTSPPTRRTEAIGTLGAGGFVGMIIGPFAGDLFLGAPVRTKGDFDLFFLAAVGSVVIALILLAFLRPTPVRASHSPIELREFVRVVRKYWPGPVLLVNVVFGLCMTIPFVFLAQYVDEIGIRRIGTFFIAYSAWGLCIRLGLRRLPEVWGRRPTLLFGLVCFGLGMFAFYLVDAKHPTWIIVPAVICGTGHGLTFHTMVGLTLEPFPIEYHGTASVLALMHLDLGTVGGAPFLGAVANKMGIHWIFAFVGLACFAVAGLYALACLGERSRRPA
ncbi:MAG: MFS transporter [Planctomycetota bacterium]